MESISRTVSQLFFGGLLMLVAGCQTDSNPWQVEKYRAPGEFTPTPQSTYAPTPRILPSVEGGGFESVNPDGSTDELDLILDELQIR